MRNGPFSGYKRRRRRRQKDISRGEDEVLLNRFRSFSLSLCSCSFPAFSAPSLLLQGFEEARAVRGTPRVRPAAPPTCSPVSVRRNKQGSASVRRPVRLSLLSTSCPIAGCNTLIISLLVEISTYSLLFPSVSFSVRVLCVCRAVSLCNHRSSVVIGSLCNRISPYLLLSLALRSKTPVVPPPFYTQGRRNPTTC